MAEALRQPDRVLYCMGNSSYHRHVYELMRERPGAVVAHDVRLTGFYGWFAGVERPEDPAGRLAERIHAFYEARIPTSVATDGSLDWRAQSAFGIYMTREIQQCAEQLFVHSRHALEVMVLDRGALDRAVPVAVLPFGIPIAEETKARTTRAVEDAPMIVSVGVVSEVKGIENLITAVGQLASERRRLRLVVAGPGEQTELHRWRSFAAELAPGVDIEIPGHLPAEEYRQLLWEADVAVQLRTVSNGEASAAVADCLATGLPTVVTDMGWASELPDGAVSLIAADASPVRLAERLEELLADEKTRHHLSEGAVAYAHSCSFPRVADAYLRSLQLV
jgi:glycosyltransferase involved in cell wall biosynthesis